MIKFQGQFILYVEVFAENADAALEKTQRYVNNVILHDDETGAAAALDDDPLLFAPVFHCNACDLSFADKHGECPECGINVNSPETEGE